ncbi:hypothetical protein KQX54_021058 [Cotesia glomerata]|uniref:Uncharacterized protein n=1 Tax=Cotesia glomerata TaxID=32391 RepID=A0AAV7IUI3_COTGL|nr:hypothetical protein KQX54_021058 [Cotesia glomerata]
MLLDKALLKLAARPTMLYPSLPAILLPPTHYQHMSVVHLPVAVAAPAPARTTPTPTGSHLPTSSLSRPRMSHPCEYTRTCHRSEVCESDKEQLFTVPVATTTTTTAAAAAANTDVMRAASDIYLRITQCYLQQPPATLSPCQEK